MQRLKIARFAPFGLMLTLLLSACSAQEFRPQHSDIGGAIQKSMNAPVIPTSVMLPEPPKREPGSLWQPGAKQFFKDQRANQVGDIVTVIVNVADEADVEANTETTRTVDNASGITNLLNVEGLLTNRGIAPGVTSLADIDSNRTYTGEGSTDRKDTVTGRIAAIVTQVLPNGFLVVQGRREVMVNYEMQEMTVQGIVRPQDIAANNTVQSDMIAEIRVTYAGKGMVDETQTTPSGVRFLDKWLPF